jgi:hypothetical protein
VARPAAATYDPRRIAEQGRRQSIQKGTRPMRSVIRSAALLLSIGALLAVPGSVSAKAPSHILYQSKLSLSSLVSCTGTGLTGPTGKIQVRIYALKGRHPAKSALTCARGIAVVKAGKADLFARLAKSVGKTFKVQGASYQLTHFFGQGASGYSPAFVGAKTAVLAVFVSGR